MSTRVARPLAVVLSFLVGAMSAALSGCGGKPPSSQADAEIDKAVRGARPDIYDGARESADVTAIKLAGWKHEEFSGKDGMPDAFSSDWTAKLRFNEPLGFIVTSIEGTRIVRIIAAKGDELEFAGTVTGVKADGKWEVGAISTKEAWNGLWQKAGDVTMGYQTYGEGGTGVEMRRTVFEPVSKLKPYVEENSPEMKALLDAAAEKQRKAQEAAAERLRLQQEAARKQQEAAAERQRLQQEEAAAARKKQQDDYAEQQRQAQEAAKQKAEEQRHARLLPLVKPLASQRGASIATDTGTLMGMAILGSEVDEKALTAKGRGVDMREMPFREFTFEAAIDERNALSLRHTLASDPFKFTAPTATGLAGAGGVSLAVLTDADRARLDAILATAKRLAEAPPAEIKVELLDAAAAKSREPAIQATAMTGTVQYRGRKNDAVAGLFATDGRGNYRWGNKEVVSIRLNEPLKTKGLYYKGGGAQTDNLIVIINGIHKVTLGPVPRLGGAILTFPSEIEILDIRLDSQGAAQSRGLVALN